MRAALLRLRRLGNLLRVLLHFASQSHHVCVIVHWDTAFPRGLLRFRELLLVLLESRLQRRDVAVATAVAVVVVVVIVVFSGDGALQLVGRLEG